MLDVCGFAVWVRRPQSVALYIIAWISAASRAGCSKPCDIDALRNQYSPEEARLYASYARLSFCRASSVEAWTCGKVCQAVPRRPDRIIFMGPGDQCKLTGYVAKGWSDAPNSPDCLISLRGSVSLWNYMADAEAWITPWPWPFSDKVNFSMPDFSNLDADTPSLLDKVKVLEDDVAETYNNTINASFATAEDFIRVGILTNISSTVPWCQGCEVHRGFACAYQEIREPMLAALKTLKCRSTGLVGHSLGGATATLAALELRSTFSPYDLHVGPVYSFGSPRVGNDKLAVAYEKAARLHDVSPSAWRIVHWYDPIVRIPSRPLFAHVGQEVYYDQSFSSFRMCARSVDGSEDPYCSVQVPLWKCAMKIAKMDHLMYFNLSFNHLTMGEECIPLIAPFLPDARRLQGEEQVQHSLVV